MEIDNRSSSFANGGVKSPYRWPGDPRGALARRLYVAVLALMGFAVLGTQVYHSIGNGLWSWMDCFYMTVITLSTVGFAETLPGMQQNDMARAWTVMLIVLGSGTLLYFVSTFTAFIVEGDLLGAIKRTRMQKRIEHLENHIVVCGVGSTGHQVVEELVSTQAPFVAVDSDPVKIEKLLEELEGIDILYIVGDATDDHTLEQAGVARARGVVAALHDDKDNLFVTVTARSLNSKARIVAKTVEVSADNKLRRAGADAVVSPNRIGGMRMVSEMLRPHVVEFLDLMLRDKDKNLRFEELEIPAQSPLIGTQLKDTDIRSTTDVLVVAVRRPDDGFIYNPRPDLVLKQGMTLIVLAQTPEIIKLRKGIADGSIGRR